jgi:TonB-linked SusC/RagA family outer membrane protein
MLNDKQYITMIQDAINNTVGDLGYTSADSRTYQNLMFNTNEIGYDPNWIYFDEYNQNINWLNEITRTGISLDNSFSMSGGGEKATYRLSLGYASDEGITIGTQYDRLNAMFNVQYKFSDKLDISTDIKYTQGKRLANWDNPRDEALTKMPNMSPYTIGNDGLPTEVYFTPNNYFQGTFSVKDDKELNGRFNPVALAYEAQSKTISNTGRVLFNLHYNVVKDLDFYSILGLDIEMNKTKKFLPQEVTGVTYVNDWYNRYLDGLSDNFVLYTENKFIYSKLLNENHKILLSSSFQTREQISSASGIGTSGSPSSSLPSSENVKNLGSGRSTTRDLGLIFNGHYTFMNRYMFNVGYRFEANSSIGPKNRVGGFPIVGAAWIMDEEKFIKNMKFISLAKLRLSWGQSGNSPGGSYPYIGIFSPVVPGYINMSPIAPVRIQLDNLKWETVTQTNGGLDMGLLDNKVTFTLDVYYKLTTDLLQKDVKLPSSTGYSTVKFYNSGKLSNHGWELVVNYEAVKSKDFGVTLTMNMAQNVNKILEIPTNKIASEITISNGSYANRIVEGDPIGSFYGFKNLGVYQNIDETYARDGNGNIIKDINGDKVIMRNINDQVYPGDAKYEDINHDGVINQYDIVYLGNSMPLTTGGFGFNIRYKNLGLSGNFQGRLGQMVINQARINMENMYGKENQSVAVLRRWRHEGDNTNIPRALYNKGYNYLGSDRFIEDGSFLRLKTLTIKYSIPKVFVNKLGITRADVYATAYDLWTITGYTGQDPEVGIKNNLAYDNAVTPKPVRVAGGFLINF